MAYRDHEDRTALVVDFVKDAIVPDPEAVTELLALQFCSATRAWVL